MFGHQNNSDQTNVSLPGGPVDDIALSSQEPETIAPTPATSAPTVADSVGDYEVTDLPHIPVTTIPAAAPLPTHADHLVVTAAPPAHTAAAPAAAPPIVVAGSSAANDLIDLKQSALHELSPLIGHLEQTPEEKFRTTMMMIQASDDQSMLQTAFGAAKEIKDEKARAQALLDVVNEINYFTQHAEAV